MLCILMPFEAAMQAWAAQYASATLVCRHVWHCSCNHSWVKMYVVCLHKRACRSAEAACVPSQARTVVQHSSQHGALF
jgi:hypothetical protein